MDFSVICRMCLSTTSVNPIFKNEHDQDMYADDVYTATGVLVRINDHLPQNICTSCEKMVDKILMFRKQCQISEAQLTSLKPEPRGLDKDNNQLSMPMCMIKNEITDMVYLNTDIDIKEDDMNLPLSLIKTESIDSDIKEETYFKTDIKLKVVSNDKLFENTDTLILYDEAGTKFSELKTDLETNLNVTNLLLKSEIKLNNKGKQNPPVNPETYSKFKKTNTKNEIRDRDNEEEELPYSVLPGFENQKNMRVICKWCQMELSIRSVDMHMAKRHPGADERKVKCELCDTYILKGNLSRHTTMMHGSGSLKCNYCKSQFDDQAILTEHIKSCPFKKKTRKAVESNREQTECDVCHKKMQKASLRMHKAIKHAGMRPVCEHCGKGFGNNRRLQEHYRAKHGYEKFKCSDCDFASANIVALRNHERRHRGEKPFVCELCGAKFHAAYLLSQHRHSHRTERTVKCDLCPGLFKTNNSMYMHKLTCHSKSMYQCMICDRAYSCRHYAAKHMRVAHNYSGPDPPLKTLPRDVTNENQ